MREVVALALLLPAREVVAAVAVEFASCAHVRCLEFPSRTLCNLLRVQARLNKGGVTDALKPTLRRVDNMPHHSRPVIGLALQSALKAPPDVCSTEAPPKFAPLKESVRCSEYHGSLLEPRKFCLKIITVQTGPGTVTCTRSDMYLKVEYRGPYRGPYCNRCTVHSNRCVFTHRRCDLRIHLTTY